MGDLIERLREHAYLHSSAARYDDKQRQWGDDLIAAADELARLRAEVAATLRTMDMVNTSASFHVRRSEQAEARAETADRERDELRRRIAEAPVVEAEPFRETGSDGSYPYAAIALTGETAKRIGGKRVALVLLDTEEAK